MTDMFEAALLGAINTYIRMINDTNEEFGDGRQIIENQYEYLVHPSTQDFHLYIIVDGEKRELIFTKEEWFGYGKNVLGNTKLKHLHDELIAA